MNQAKSSSLKETKRIKEELELERSQSQDYKMRLVANLTQVQKELFEVKRENDRMSRGNSREPPASIREPRFVQESAEEEENARHHANLSADFRTRKLRQETSKDRQEHKYHRKLSDILSRFGQASGGQDDPHRGLTQPRKDSRLSKDKNIVRKTMNFMSEPASGNSQQDQGDYDSPDSNWSYSEQDEPRSYEKHHLRRRGDPSTAYCNLLITRGDRSASKNVFFGMGEPRKSKTRSSSMSNQGKGGDRKKVRRGDDGGSSDDPSSENDNDPRRYRSFKFKKRAMIQTVNQMTVMTNFT